MRRYRRRTRPQYLLPFLGLIALGVVLVLTFQLWGLFFPNVKGDAVYFLAEGRSKVLSFGTTEWDSVYNGSKVKLGDSVKTLANAKGVMTFYDGTMLRMDENTQITLVDISKKNDYQEILINLNEGRIWVNKPKQNVIRKTDFVINTNWASYAITGTVFDLEKYAAKETLRVLRGQVQVDVIENADGKIRTIESLPVGLGQESNLDETVMKAFYERQSPSILSIVDPNFQSTEWSIWNSKEDENPTNFAKTPGINEGTINDRNSTTEISTISENLDSTDKVELSSFAPLTLTLPKSNLLKTSKDQQTISGKAIVGIKKVLLRQRLAGSDKVEKILINNFDVQALTWSYDLSELKSNLKAGLNTYEFVGVDESAKETLPLKVEIEYQKDGISKIEPDEANDLNSLEKPKVSTIDGKVYKDGMALDKDGFAISGTVKGGTELWVDEFKLGKFKAGDTSWTLNVKESYGNLKPGLNTYQVFTKDASGKKSPVLTVNFNYNKKVVTQPVVSSPAVKPPVVVVPSTTSTTTNNTTPVTNVVVPPTISERPLNS